VPDTSSKLSLKIAFKRIVVPSLSIEFGSVSLHRTSLQGLRPVRPTDQAIQRDHQPLRGTIQTLQKELALPGEITIETILRSPGVISASEQVLLDSATRCRVGSCSRTASPDARKRRLQSPQGVASPDQIHRPCSLKNSQASATRREAVSRAPFRTCPEDRPRDYSRR